MPKPRRIRAAWKGPQRWSFCCRGASVNRGIASCSIVERSKQMVALVCFWVPLDAKQPAAVGCLASLYDPIGGSGGNDQAVADPVDRLMMVTADHVPVLARGLCDQRARFEHDLVLSALEATDHLAVRMVPLRRDQVLLERSPERHVDYLCAAADTEHREPPCQRAVYQCDLELVTLRVGPLGDWLAAGAIYRGINIGPADQKQGVNTFEQRKGRPSIKRQEHGQRARPLHRRNIGVRDQV